MKRLVEQTPHRLSLLAALLVAVTSVFMIEDGYCDVVDPWTDNFETALTRAAEDGRYLLLNFTGTDWCVWCHRLRDEVFVQAPFLDYAATALVLVEVDFPRKTELPETTRIQNAALDERFDVSGYPTIVIVSPDNKEIGRLSYMQGGAKTFVRAVKKLIREAEG